jgi:hypothetical protein
MEENDAKEKDISSSSATYSSLNEELKKFIRSDHHLTSSSAYS